MKTKFHTVAGGVVLNDAGRVLVLERHIERDGKIIHEIRLPKGHLDPGETEAQAAVREVGEESGYWEAAITGDLGVAHSAFDFKGKHHERDERYFLMRLENPMREAPQPTGKEEALFVPQWLTLEDAESAMTYPSEQEFIRRARQFLQ